VRVISNKLGNYSANRRHIFEYDDVELVVFVTVVAWAAGHMISLALVSG